MTEFELTQAVMTTNELMLYSIEWHMTIITGYLLIAHFIGERLSTFQVSLINTLYTYMYISVTIAINIQLVRLYYYTERLLQINPDYPTPNSFEGTTISTIIIASLLFLASLYFMWHVRHRKKSN